MTQTQLQTNQIVNQDPITRLESSTRQQLDTMFTKIAKSFNEPGWIYVSGGAVSGSVIEIGNTEIDILDSGKSKAYPPVNGIDVTGVSGTFSFATGTGTGSVQSSTLPTMTANQFVKCGFELRSNKLIYPLFGTPAATLALAGTPAFSSGISMGLVNLKNNGTGGAGNFLTTVNDDIVQYTGAGSGSSSSSGAIVNYLASSNKAWNFEGGSSAGWAIYSDVAGVAPVNGAGAGTITATFAASATAPQRGLYSGLLTKTAANSQGQGVSVAFTLDTQDVGKPFTFSFDTLASASFTGISGSESARVYCYDVTNSALLPGYVDISPGTSTTKGFFLATSSTSYRFIIHISGTGTSAWTMKVDNVIIGQQTVLLANSITTTMTDKTVTPSNFGTVTNSFFSYYITGNRVIGRATWKNGTVVSSALSITIPFTIDTTGIQTVAGSGIVGRAQRIRTGGTPAAAQIVDVFYDGTNTSQLFFSVASASDALSKSIGGDWASNNDYTYVEFNIPVVGYNSNIQLADRAVEEFAYNTSTSTSASDTTSFANGAVGAQIQNITAGLTRRIRFQTPIQATDTIIVEVRPSTATGWVDVSKITVDSSGNAWFQPWTYQNGTEYGFGRVLQVNSTDCDIRFGQYVIPIGTYGAAGQAWGGGSPAGGSAFWRVRKISGGALVGYPIGARNIVGDTTGTTVPKGYIGEVIADTPGDVHLNSATATNVAAVILTAGVWQLFGKVNLNATSLSAWTSVDVSISTTSATHSVPSLQRDASTSTTTARWLGPSPRVIATTGQTVYMVCSTGYTGTSVDTTGANTQFYAVRIG